MHSKIEKSLENVCIVLYSWKIWLFINEHFDIVQNSSTKFILCLSFRSLLRRKKCRSCRCMQLTDWVTELCSFNIQKHHLNKVPDWEFCTEYVWYVVDTVWSGELCELPNVGPLLLFPKLFQWNRRTLCTWGWPVKWRNVKICSQQIRSAEYFIV